MDSEARGDKTYRGNMSRSNPLRSIVPDVGESDSEESLSDEGLVEGLLAGDRRLAKALYNRVRPTIDGTLRRVLHQRGADFEDLVQVTFERIIRSFAEGRFEGRCRLKTWASAIASHVALDALRRKQRERLRIDDNVEQGSLPSGTHSEKRLESLAELRRVQGILSEMKPNLAQTLILHDVLGHTLREIAQSHSVSESAVQSRLHRARLELKRRAVRPISRRGR